MVRTPGVSFIRMSLGTDLVMAVWKAALYLSLSIAVMPAGGNCPIPMRPCQWCMFMWNTCPLRKNIVRECVETHCKDLFQLSAVLFWLLGRVGWRGRHSGFVFPICLILLIPQFFPNAFSFSVVYLLSVSGLAFRCGIWRPEKRSHMRAHNLW